MKPRNEVSQPKSPPSEAKRKRGRKPIRYDDDDDSSSSKRKYVKKNKAPDDLKWLYKEKVTVLEALTEIKNPKIPDDLSTIQRKLCRRSTSEIEAFLNNLVTPALQKIEKNEKAFADTNYKQWIDGCDRLSGVDRTCSKTGNGVIEIAHPALAIAELFAETDFLDDYKVLNGKESTPLDFEWKNVYWFIKKVFEGVDPFEEWSCRCKLESAVIMELLEELSNSAKQVSFDRQQEFFFDKYRESDAPALTPPYVEQPLPTDVYDSKFLNPLGMIEQLCQGVEEVAPPPNLLLLHYQTLLRKKKKSGSAE